MASPHVVHWRSAHPVQVKRSYISSETLRTLRNCRYPLEDAEEDINDLAERCRLAEYPEWFIDKHINNGRTRYQGILTKVAATANTEDPMKLHRPREYRQRHKKRGERGIPGKPYVMWIPRRSDKFRMAIQRCFDKRNLPFYVRELAGRSIRRTLCKSKIGPPPKCTNPGCLHCMDTDDQEKRQQCQASDVIYEVKCMLCHENGEEAIYCGQTERKCSERFEEHLKVAIKAANAEDNDNTDAMNRAKHQAIGYHYFHKHRIRNEDEDPPPKLDMKIVWRCSGSLDRDAMEATYVRREPRFNMNRKQQDNGINL